MDKKKAIICFLNRILYKYYCITNSVQKRIVFSSFFGKQYSDNPRAICEYMHDKFPEYRLAWILNEEEDKYDIIPSYVEKIVKSSKKHIELKTIASSFAYVTNCEFIPNISKRKKQIFIQTFHGTGFKKVLHDRYEGDTMPVPVYDNSVTDICMSNSEYLNQIYRSAFRYYGEIQQLGSARVEKLLNISEEEKKEIRRKLGLPENVNVVLFAPTFRDAIKIKQPVQVDLVHMLEVLEKKGSEWICLVRSHLASMGIDMGCDNKRFFDVTEYPDMTDIMAISDMLITDYSSSATDFMRTKKPVILATFDADEYEANSRAFTVTPKEAGFFVADNQNELDDIILSKTHMDYINCYDTVDKFFGITETGIATDTICRRIDDFYHKNY